MTRLEATIECNLLNSNKIMVNRRTVNSNNPNLRLLAKAVRSHFPLKGRPPVCIRLGTLKPDKVEESLQPNLGNFLILFGILELSCLVTILVRVRAIAPSYARFSEIDSPPSFVCLSPAHLLVKGSAGCPNFCHWQLWFASIHWPRKMVRRTLHL